VAVWLELSKNMRWLKGPSYALTTRPEEIPLGVLPSVIFRSNRCLFDLLRQGARISRVSRISISLLNFRQGALVRQNSNACFDEVSDAAPPVKTG
jgi:hypothetical protein